MGEIDEEQHCYIISPLMQTKWNYKHSRSNNRTVDINKISFVLLRRLYRFIVRYLISSMIGQPTPALLSCMRGDSSARSHGSRSEWRQSHLGDELLEEISSQFIAIQGQRRSHLSRARVDEVLLRGMVQTIFPEKERYSVYSST
ncbi:hypothetical protein CEXT_365161 [Caerostris extrusa]|uniref:Maturase K n=1 Tax=Caerostris extrusa TaxID=172846 RepID=A0AAV4VBD2_CAEEX|nr:hypothetical protein CEXT_365161 [Caerostris extrusa]